MIYFDNNATMPFSLSAREAWNESQEFFWFNPAGLSNESTKVRVLIKEAKQELGSYFDRSADQVIFTSGSTESNNLVFQSLSKILGNKKKILLHADEHSSVLKPAQSCFRNQWDFFNFYDNKFYADTKILLDLGALVICAANGETGSISPLSKALDITDQEGIFSFCDAYSVFW
jgi:cysteine desulfurase